MGSYVAAFCFVTCCVMVLITLLTGYTLATEDGGYKWLAIHSVCALWFVAYGVNRK